MSSPNQALYVTICGVDELSLHRKAGATHVLSILDPGSPEPGEFDFWDPHERLSLRFHDVIDDISDAEIEPPTTNHVAAILKFGGGLPLDRPVHVLVHCHGGISRSTASALLLIAQREPSRSPHGIVAQIARLRPQAWPNLRIVEIGDRELGRGGRLVAAARRRYREVALERPDFAAEMRAGGRGREVDG